MGTRVLGLAQVLVGVLGHCSGPTPDVQPRCHEHAELPHHWGLAPYLTGYCSTRILLVATMAEKNQRLRVTTSPQGGVATNRRTRDQGGGRVHQDEAREIHGTASEDGSSAHALDVGTPVYVRNRFLGDWSSGFKVAEVLDDGYRLRRLSDGQVFTDVFPFHDVHRERRQHPLRGVDESWLDRRQG